MLSEKNRLLNLRAQIKKKKPKFRSQESWRYKRVKPSWRRPKGIDNKARKKKKGTFSLVNIGYRSPKKVRYLHASGYPEVVIHNIKELEKVDYRKNVVKIGHSVGRQKRILLQDRADELNILILNRTRILLPGEELLMESRGLEKEKIIPGEIEELEEPYPEEIESAEDDLLDEDEFSEDNEELEE